MDKIVTFGEIMLRLSPESFYRLFQNDRMRASFGGAEANVAVALSQLGAQTEFVTRLPFNLLGDAAINNLRSFGIETKHICRGGNRLGVYYLEKGANQRGSVCIYDRSGSAISQAPLDAFSWEEIFSEAKWFHFTGITPALGGNLPSICMKACETAKAKGIKISCDLNFRSKLWSREEAEKIMSRLCSLVDICIANEEDAKSVFGMEDPDSDVCAGIINKEAYTGIARRLVERFGFEKVAFTFRTSLSASNNNWAGMLYTEDGCFFSKEYEITDIVDRVGAGDSFGAGLIYGLCCGYDDQYSLDFAVALSALKHSVEGDFHRFSIEEVERLLNGDASGRVQR